MIFINNFIKGKYCDITNKLMLCYNSLLGKINIQEEIDKNEKLLCVTDVYGEGITITINDGSDITHQEDIIVLLDELKNAGAEAISINDQRITNFSYIYCDGNVILIDGQKIQVPFIIKAIGNKSNLNGAMTRNKGYLETLKKAGLEIKIEENEKIEIKKSNNNVFESYNQEKNNFNKIIISNKLIGKSKVNGFGIKIRIDNKITALYLLQIINELRSGGATAIEINGQRITNMTDIVEISETIFINSNSISDPYIINAIGNTKDLIEEMNLSNSTLNKLKQKEATVEITEEKNIVIDKYVPKRENSKMILNYIE